MRFGTLCFLEGTIRTEDARQVTLEDLLVFCTGAKSEPPLGFPDQPKLTFVEGKLVTASTCALVTRLPLGHSNYEQFKTYATLSFAGHGGFGVV